MEKEFREDRNKKIITLNGMDACVAQDNFIDQFDSVKLFACNHTVFLMLTNEEAQELANALNQVIQQNYLEKFQSEQFQHGGVTS